MSREQQTTGASCWDALDGIVVINLDHRAERWEHCLNEVCTHFPAGRVHRLSAVDGLGLPGYAQLPWFTESTGERARYWGGAAGCVLSHRRAIELAKERQWRQVLILEDDVDIDTVTLEQGKVLDWALKTLRGAFLLYLGYNKPRPYGRRIHREGDVALWRISGVLAAHAYVVPAGMYDRLLRVLPQENTVWEWLSLYRALDTFYRDYISTLSGVPTYAILPQFFHQGEMESSILPGTVVDESFRSDDNPGSYGAFPGILHCLSKPLRCVKILLNSRRTHRRALKGGLPGWRKDA